MRVRVVLAVALALVGAGVVLVLSQRAPRMAGTSFVPVRTFAVTVPPHAQACQPATYVPADSAAVRVLTGSFGQPLPRLSVTLADAGGRPLARGAHAGGGPQGEVTIPLDAVVAEERYGATACVRNHGGAPVALGGDVAGPGSAARVGGEVTQGAVGFRYLRPGRESWWSLLGAISERFGRGKSAFFGTWTLPLCALALAALWVAALRLLAREAP